MTCETHGGTSEFWMGQLDFAWMAWIRAAVERALQIARVVDAVRLEPDMPSVVAVRERDRRKVWRE